MLFDRIALFVDVARDQSLVKTAKRIHVSPSSVSQRLKSLERDFGVKLYKRGKDGIELTNEGWIVLSTATQVLDQLDTLRDTLNPRSSKKVQTLVVGGTQNPSARVLPTALAAFQKDNPEIKVKFLTSSRANVEKWVRDGDVDIAIIQSPSDACMTALSTEHFAVDKVACFAHTAHSLAKKQKITIKDLAETPLIVREGTGTTHKLLALLQSRGVKPNVALRCESPDAVKTAVRKKMGIGILFYDQIDEEVRRKDFKILKVSGLPRLVGKSYIVYHKNRSLDAPASKFLTLLRHMKSRQKTPLSIYNLTGTASR